MEAVVEPRCRFREIAMGRERAIAGDWPETDQEFVRPGRGRAEPHRLARGVVAGELPRGLDPAWRDVQRRAKERGDRITSDGPLTQQLPAIGTERNDRRFEPLCASSPVEHGVNPSLEP